MYIQRNRKEEVDRVVTTLIFISIVWYMMRISYETYRIIYKSSVSKGHIIIARESSDI